jgi:hypothetical protein
MPTKPRPRGARGTVDAALHVAAPARAMSAGDAAWLAAVPAALVAVLAILLIGPWLGTTLLPHADARYWSNYLSEVHPEPIEQGRFLLALTAPLLLAGFTVGVRRLRPRWEPTTIDALVVAIQAAAIGFVVLCLLQQQRGVLGPLYPAEEEPAFLLDFFTPATLLVAAAGTVAVVWAIGSARLRASLTSWTRETRKAQLAAGVVALGAIVVWLSHAAYTERTIGAAHTEVLYHLQFPLDETFAVLDGRTPLVDFAAQYGSLWPYAFAAGMSALGDSVGVWVTMALVATGLGMAAVYTVLRCAARSSIRGLLLFLPVLATSFFMLGGTRANRYTYGDYYGTFPIRYAGPAILAWLVARHLGGAKPRRAWLVFLAGGIVALNNADVGIPAFGATAAALLWGGGRLTRARAVRLALKAAGGLLAAFALVSALTLARAGALPDLGLLLRFSRLFAAAGVGLARMPTIGLHLVVYLTYVAAFGVATVRLLRAESDRLLTGMLAWSAVFGLGAGAYFAGRSTPENLVATFFPWSVALALLLVPALRELGPGWWHRRPPLAAIACVFGFLVMACSLAQTPTPWEQLQRLQRSGPPILAEPRGQRFIAQHTHRGEPAAILVLLGHRIGVDLDVRNVSPYSNGIVMPFAEQLDEAIAALRAAGGRKLFLMPDFSAEDMQQALAHAGFRRIAQDAGEDTALWIDGSTR